jgi:SAM-dependent methyltransferase
MVRPTVHPPEIIDRTSPSSARVVVPILCDLVSPTSVLDVGCGTGAWLAAFGDIRSLGIDVQDPTVVQGQHYEQHDLTRSFDYGRFDLAICVEVAEHLPASAAGTLVDSLVNAAPVVAFSAAVPGQGGFGHVNLQWPDYWAALFGARGYRQFDAVRWRIWDDDRVAPWYRQNLFLYSADRDFDVIRPMGPIVLTEFQPKVLQAEDFGPKELLRALPESVRRFVRRKRGRASIQPRSTWSRSPADH